MKKAVFFLRHNNDLDHITPILHKWILTKNIATDIIITSDESFLNDYRIKYLKEISKGRQDIHFHHINNYFRGSFWHWFNNFYSRHSTKLDNYTFIQNRIDTVCEEMYKHFLYGDVLSEPQLLCCFDWTSNYFTNKMVSLFKPFHSTVALPHGDEPYWNIIQKDQEINYKATLVDNLHEEIFDYVAVPNELCSRRYSFMSDRVKTLGSPRYCSEWIPIHDSIKPKLNLGISPVLVQSGAVFPLKVVLFLRNKHWPINWEELRVLVKLIAQFKPILIIKGHSRGAFQEQMFYDNPNIIVDLENKHSASTLIDWADLVLDVGTSTVWEAIQKQKPLLMLDYICGNQTTISQYMPGLAINCRDDLFEHMRKFTKNHQRNLYKEHQRQKFIREMIEKDDQTLNNYCNFLEGLINVETEVKG